MTARKPAFVKADAICLKRNVLPPSRLSAQQIKKRRDVAHRGMSPQAARIGAPRMSARPAVARTGTSREVARTAADRDRLRNRYQQVDVGRRQPPEPHSLAHKTKREWQRSR